MIKRSALELLDYLKNSNLANIDQGILSFIIKQQQNKEIPQYVRILMGIGAFLATFFILFYLWEIDVF
jgi:hypothetical protein